MSTSLTSLSASVTRILSLTGFPKELKTKDIQSAFSEYEGTNGGFKIKWKDDTSLLIVFQDPSIAKRAYLHTLANPPPILISATTGILATIKPYDGPDAQGIITSVNSRHNSNPSRSHNARSSSISVFPTSRSISSSSSGNLNQRPGQQTQHVTIPENAAVNGTAREPSPTLPSLPSHPTLNYLINSSLSEAVAGASPTDNSNAPQELNGAGPRIGDPGKRMLGAALGVRHPGLGPRNVNGNANGPAAVQGGSADHAMREVQKAMGGLVVEN